MALTQDRTDVAKVLADTKKHVLVNWSAQGNISPLVITGAEGVWLHSGDRRILDFSSELVNSNLGHGHPRVVRAIQEQAATLNYVTPAFTTVPILSGTFRGRPASRRSRRARRPSSPLAGSN